MSLAAEDALGAGACTDCLRRCWLLASLTASLDYRCGDRERLTELLALDDDLLLEALAGSRRGALRARYARFERRELNTHPQVETFCRHDPGYPTALEDPGGPRMLNVLGGVVRLRALLAEPAVAILGSSRPTDYGLEVARSLARGLAASHVAVVAALGDGIPAAVHAGTLEANGASVAVMGGGLDVACPARRRVLYEHLQSHGCAISELPCGCDGRRWGAVAAARIVARLARVTVVVEAEEDGRVLGGARIAQALERVLAAVPGRVTSPASGGTNALLIEGAVVVRGPQDVLELLHGAGPAPAGASPRAHPPVDGEDSHVAPLPARLRSVLERVGAGCDTAAKLTEHTEEVEEVLLAVSELEAMGLLGRGDGGRYLPRDQLPPRARTSRKSG